MPGRTDNDIKNYWNTKLKKKLMGLLPPSSNHGQIRKLPPTLFHSPSHLHDYHQIQSPPFTSHQQSYLRDFTSYLYPSPPSSTISFTGLHEPTTSVIMPPSTTNNFPYFQNQEAPLVNGSGQMQYYYMLGSEGTSCSTSSDGSCSQISHGGDVKHEENMGFHQFHQNFNLSNNNNTGGFDHQFTKFMPGGETSINQWTSEKQTSGDNDGGYFGQNPLMDYGIEEIKQMISGGNYNNDDNPINVEGNKREEEEKGMNMMYYYY